MPNFGVNDRDRRTADALERIWADRRKEQVMTIRQLIDSGDISMDTEVLGVLEKTVDGAIIGTGAWCWLMLPGVMGRDDDKPCRMMFRPCPIVDPDAYSGKRMVFSSRESALADHERSR